MARRKEKVGAPPSDPEVTEDAQSAPAPVSAAKRSTVYVVAPGRSITCGPRGVLCEGDPIGPMDVGGQESLNAHIRAGTVAVLDTTA